MDSKQQEAITLLYQLEPLMHRYAAFRHHGAGRNPHRGQGRVLAALKLKDEISQRDLAFLLDMSKQALGELLRKLEAAGYVSRHASSEDARVMMISLTEEGKKAAEDNVPEENSANELFASLTEEELDALITTLKKLIEACRAAVPNRTGRLDGRTRNGFDFGGRPDGRAMNDFRERPDFAGMNPRNFDWGNFSRDDSISVSNERDE